MSDDENILDGGRKKRIVRKRRPSRLFRDRRGRRYIKKGTRKRFIRSSKSDSSLVKKLIKKGVDFSKPKVEGTSSGTTDWEKIKSIQDANFREQLEKNQKDNMERVQKKLEEENKKLADDNKKTADAHKKTADELDLLKASINPVLALPAPAVAPALPAPTDPDDLPLTVGDYRTLTQGLQSSFRAVTQNFGKKLDDTLTSFKQVEDDKKILKQQKLALEQARIQQKNTATQIKKVQLQLEAAKSVKDAAQISSLEIQKKDAEKLAADATNKLISVQTTLDDTRKKLEADELARQQQEKLLKDQQAQIDLAAAQATELAKNAPTKSTSPPPKSGKDEVDPFKDQPFNVDDPFAVPITKPKKPKTEVEEKKEEKEEKKEPSFDEGELATDLKELEKVKRKFKGWENFTYDPGNGLKTFNYDYGYHKTNNPHGTAKFENFNPKSTFEIFKNDPKNKDHPLLYAIELVKKYDPTYFSSAAQNKFKRYVGILKGTNKPTPGGGSEDGLGDDALYNFELEKIMRPHKGKGYQATIAADQIGQLEPKKKMSFIMNKSTSKEPGSHWVAVNIDADDDKSVEYYDPLADEPDPRFYKDIKVLVDKIKPDTFLKMKVNRIKGQDERSSTCGFHCVKFLINRFNGVPFKEATPYTDVRKNENQAQKMAKKWKKFGYI